MVPFALGQDVDFIENEGPKLSKFNFEIFSNNNERSFSKKLDPIYRAIEITKKLDKNKSLIGFIGAPWTLYLHVRH